MKLLLTIPFTVITFWLAAQVPVNDNCSGIIDLGVAPFCSTAAQFTNVNATASNIDPQFNIPSCFNNNAERDVWFQFSLPVDGSITDITLSVWGNVGGNGTLRMPELALYRGDCIFGGLSELACMAAPLNINELHLDFLGLNAGETYFLRVNDYSSTGTPNWGTFKLCVEKYVADFNMGDAPGAQSCYGTLWDSGGEDDPYSSNENLTFTICPQDFHQCLQINVLDYITEAGFDFLRVYEGNGTNGLLLAEFDGAGSNDQVNVSGGGCATIEFQSDGTLNNSGFHLTWECSSDVCPPPPPTPPSASTCATALPINGCSQSLPNIISLAPGTGDPNFITDGLNAGCIANPSQTFNFAFFYFRAQANGNFGFLVKNGDPNNPSDIDFNVWGPIDNDADICDFVTNNQPVRSSWTAAPSADNPEGQTGLTDSNPYNGDPVTDEFDCGSPTTPGQGILPTDDSFVKTLAVQQGKIYVVMLDDYDGAVQSQDGISIDFSGSSAGVLDPVQGQTVIVSDDQTICPGQSAQLSVTGGYGYAWTPSSTLSCNTCPNPIALPVENTTYLVQIATVCALLKDSVKVNLLNLDLGPDANVCIGASFTLNDHPLPGQYTWFGSPGLDCDTCASPTFTAANAGTAILGCIITTPFCSDTDYIKINIAGGEQPDIVILPDTIICAGDMITLGGPPSLGFSYLWTANPPGSAPNPPNTSNPPPFSPTGTATYYLKTTSPACFFPRIDSVLVQVYQRPVISVINGASFCLGDSVLLGQTVFQPNVTYAWTPNDGSFSDTTQINPVVTPQTPGIHQYLLTASTPGCSTTATVPVFAIDLNLNLSVPDTVYLCKGSSKEITASVSPVGTAQVTWSPIQGLQISPDGLTAVASPQNNTLYTASVTVPGGCTRIKKVLVKVDSLPPFLDVVPKDTSVCLGAIVLLKKPDNEPLFEPSEYIGLTFHWEPGIGLLTTPEHATIFVQPTDTVVYTRIATIGGCSDTVSVTVNVTVPPDDFKITPEESTICQDSAVVLTAHANGIDSLLWTPAMTLSCDDCLMPTARPLTSTTYNLSGKFNKCPVATTAVVNVNPKPVYQFPAGGNKCAGETLQLNLVDDPSVTSYHWSSNPPSTIPQVSQPVVTLDANGVQSISYYLEADNGCPVLDTFMIQVTGVLLTVSAPDTICPGLTKLINAAASIGGGQYSWTNAATTQATVVMPTETTTYTVNYDLNGCTFQDSVKISVQGQTPEIQFPSDVALCPGDTVILNSASTPGSTYSWTADVGGFTSHDSIPPPQVLFQSTTYTVTATSPDGCSITKMLPVTVFTATLSVSDNVIVCAGEPFTVSATGSATGTYVWEPGGIMSPTFTDTLDNQQTIHYSVDYTYGTPGNECHLDSMVTVQVLRNFAVKITADPDSVVNAGESVLLDAVIQPSQSVNGFTFSWLENNTAPVGNTEQVTVTPMTVDPTVSYTVTVMSPLPNGCTQTATIQFRVVQPKVEYPNAFTPNGDGSNDTFGLVVTEGVAFVERMEIYNRWGQKVYESTDPEARWDGKVDGKDAASDVYVFKIRWRRGDGSLTVKSGEVTLLR